MEYLSQQSWAILWLLKQIAKLPAKSFLPIYINNFE